MITVMKSFAFELLMEHILLISFSLLYNHLHISIGFMNKLIQ